MAKKQTRRSVSVRGSTYAQIRGYCDMHGISMSEFVEARIATFFGNGVKINSPAPSPKTPKERPFSEEEKLSSDEKQDAARVFTF
ncbi:MAG: hypothetical protein V1754_03025 [Pseudomonadota bacterium]